MAALEARIERSYRQYIAACNNRQFERLGEFVTDDVAGVREGLIGYTDALRQITMAFPDIHWTIEDLVIGHTSLAARLRVAGTQRGSFEHLAPTGYRVDIQELAIYHYDGAKIARCWGDLEAVLRDKLHARIAPRLAEAPNPPLDTSRG